MIDINDKDIMLDSLLKETNEDANGKIYCMAR